MLLDRKLDRVLVECLNLILSILVILALNLALVVSLGEAHLEVIVLNLALQDFLVKKTLIIDETTELLSLFFDYFRLER